MCKSQDLTMRTLSSVVVTSSCTLVFLITALLCNISDENQQ
jgi:hypothetical protein